MVDEIKIFSIKRMDLRGSVVIDGFPSVGLVSTISANYLISALELEQIGILDSIHFPTVSVVRGAEPLNPVRIYGGYLPTEDPEEEGKKLVVFISEFQPPSNLIKMIASTILDWMQEQGCELLISPEGLVIDRGEGETPEEMLMGGEDDEEEEEEVEEEPHQLEAYGIGSTPRCREMISDAGIPLFEEGVISGVAGVLLNEGKRRDFNVISVLAEAKPNFPDARAAATVIESISLFIPELQVDVEPLYNEATSIEAKIKSMRKQAKSEGARSPHMPSMYG